MMVSATQLASVFLLLLCGWLRVAAQTSGSKIDIPKLIRSAQLNGETMSKRVFDYSWKSKTLVQEFKRKRVVKKIDQDHEVYPSRGVTFVVQKLVKENGVPLAPKRAEKEQKRADAELTRADTAAAVRADGETSAAKRTGCPAFGIWAVLNGSGGKETSLGVSDFLCFASFFSPRIERKEGRDTVVMLFRPREGSLSLPKEKTPFAKLVGVIWIDLKDKIVSHIEAWPVENPGEVSAQSLPPAPAPILFDDMRLADGTWVRRALYVDTRSDPKAFNGLNLECKQEFSGYQRYFIEFKDYKLEEPKSPATPELPSGSPP
jgi:hypothetical protein